MVIKMERSPLTQELAFLPQGNDEGDGFALFNLLEKAGLQKDVRVACWDGYEDCIVFNS